MRWWCAQLYEPWTWTWRPYLGVWLLLFTFVVTRQVALRRRRAATGSDDVTTRQRVWFCIGLAAVWAASDWPLGALGAGYLASVHMTQFLLYFLVAAPMFLLASPEWWVRRLLARLRSYQLMTWLSRPVHAAVIANVVVVGTHSPWTVDTFRGTQLGSFALDVIWFLGGIVMWWPVISPLPEHRISSPPMRGGYLFVATVFSLIPAGFMTFARSPLYSSYEIAPRVGLDALDDQQLAGAIMKVGAMPIVWGTIVVLWARWAMRERARDVDDVRDLRAARPTAQRGTTTPPVDPVG